MRKLVPDIEIQRKDNETPLDYHKRLIYGKLVDHTLSDIDYTELAERAYGRPYSSDVARRMFYGSKRTLELMDEDRVSNTNNPDVLSELDAKMIELRSERQKFNDQRNAFNKVIRERSRQEELNEILVNAIKDGDLPKLNYEPINIETDENCLLVSLNDIHYGIEVSNAWERYNPDVCRERMNTYLNKLINIARTHKSKRCVVYNCGDSISGRIHQTIQIENKENVIGQVKGISELIAEFLAELSKHFNSIDYISVAGNHSRLDTKDNSPVDERMDDLIEWYLAARLQDFENIHICTEQRIDPTMFLIEIYGKLYCGVHGDLENSPTKISAIQAMIQQPIYAILSGHLHHNSYDEVQGIKTLMAGSFLGADDYCVQKRICSRPEQIACVCDDSGIVCQYHVSL